MDTKNRATNKEMKAHIILNDVAKHQEMIDSWVESIKLRRGLIVKCILQARELGLSNATIAERVGLHPDTVGEITAYTNNIPNTKPIKTAESLEADVFKREKDQGIMGKAEATFFGAE